jgi:hypothetical protein
MDPPATTFSTPSPPIPVEVSCLKCNRKFDGIKYIKGTRGKFRVSCRGLALHFRYNDCQGPCLQYYLDRNISTTDFSSSILVVEPAPVIPPPASLAVYFEEDYLVDIEDEPEDSSGYFGEPETSSSHPTSCVPSFYGQSFDTNSIPSSAGIPPAPSPKMPHAQSSSRPSTNCHKNAHKQLDYFLFHKLLEPASISPSVNVNKSPSYSLLASLHPPNSAKAPSSLIMDDAHGLGLAHVEEDESSSDGSATGSFQSLDGEGEAFDVAGVPVGNESSNWMVTKRHQLVTRESRQSPATSQLHAEVRLLKLLTKHKAPLQMFPVIQEWARDCARLKHDFSRSVRPRAKVLSELEDRFDMHSSRFTPTIVSYLPDERPTVVYIASFADAVYSLLSDPELMNEENLSFPDPHDPFLFAEAPHPDGRARRKPDLSELHHGSWHNDTQQARCPGPEDVLAPVIFYMDGVATDAFGRLGLTPLNFTLGIFNAATRAKKEAWVTIYYHPDDGAEASLHKNTTTAFHKIQNLHRGLDAAFSEFRQITRLGGLRWDKLVYGGQVHDVNFKFAVAFVIGDTEMHDKLCGKTVNRTNNAKCLCRHCDTPLAETINPDHRRNLFKKATFDRHNASNNFEYFTGISHHPGIVNAFHNIDMGENICNIHLASPGEILHMHQKGPMMRFVEGLEHLIKEKGTESDDVARNIGQSLKRLNILALHYGALLSRGSERNLPRTKFKNSLFSGTKKAGHEQAGVLLDLLLALVSDRGAQILQVERTLDYRYIGDQIAMCELCLGLQEWMKKDSIGRAELRDVPDAMGYFITFQEQVTKRGGMGTLLVKNHLFFHLFDYIKRWGPLRQMNSGPSESHHKTEVKAPSMNTQRRPATFVKQCSTRYTELRVIRKACQKLGISEQQVLNDRPYSVHPATIPVSGTRYSLGLINDVPSMRWDSKSHKHRVSIHAAVIQLVCEVVLPLVHPLNGNAEACVPCFTENKRWNGVEHIIFRAHPCYRSKERHPKDVWYDWATFSFEDGKVMPCQILCFMDLSKQPKRRKGQDSITYRGYVIDDPVQYAVVRKFKALPTPLEFTYFIRWGELEDGFFIFPCSSIHGTLCVVPNIPMLPWPELSGSAQKKKIDLARQASLLPKGGYFTVDPLSGWEEWFTNEVVLQRNDEE